MKFWIAVLALCATGLGAANAMAQASVVEAQDCPPIERQSSQAPEYPDALKSAQVAGEVVLVIVVDRCGLASNVEVEKSSGHPALDQAAARAAMHWRFNPKDGGAKLRIPVRFDPSVGGPEPPPSSRSRPRDQYFAQRRAMKATPPKLDPSGKVVGFVLDEFPIGISTVEEGVALLDRHAQRQTSPEPALRQYYLLDEEGISFWFLVDDPSIAGKAIYRQRGVGDGSKGFWVTSSLCEPKGTPVCKGFEAYLAGFTAQEPLPPPPPAPPPPPED